MRAEAEQLVGRAIDDDELASYLMYPSVFVAFAAHRDRYGDVSVLDTPVFFYGVDVMHETEIELERGKIIFVRLAAISEPDDAGKRVVYFELNGQSRSVSVADAKFASLQKARPTAQIGNPKQVGAPIPGQVVKVDVAEGRAVRKGDPLVTIEAMKMQTILHADFDGTPEVVSVRIGQRVEAGDLLVEWA
jgi:pyruvate carboxylase